MTAQELNSLYGTMIPPDARVNVPEAWMPAVHEAMQALVDLPTEVRAFIIVIAIDHDANGDIRFSVAGAVEFLTSAGLGMVRAVTDRAVEVTQTGSLH